MQNVNTKTYANILATAQTLRVYAVDEESTDVALRKLAEQFFNEHEAVVREDGDEYAAVAELIVRALLGDEAYDSDDEQGIDAQSDFDYYAAYFTNKLVC